MEYVPNNNKKPTEDDIKNMPDYKGSDYQKRLQEKAAKGRESSENLLEAKSQKTVDSIKSEVEDIKSAAFNATTEEKNDIDASLDSAQKQIVAIENKMRQADIDKDEIVWDALEEQRKELQQKVSELQLEKSAKNSITNIETNEHDGKQLNVDGAKKEDFDVPPQQEDVLKKAILDNQPFSYKTDEELLANYEENKKQLDVVGVYSPDHRKQILSDVSDMENALMQRGAISGPITKKMAEERKSNIDNPFSATKESNLDSQIEDAFPDSEDKESVDDPLKNLNEIKSQIKSQKAISDAKADFDRIKEDFEYKRKNDIYVSAAAKEKYDAVEKKYNDLVKESGLDADLEQKLAKFEKEKTKSWFNKKAEGWKKNNPKLHGAWAKYNDLKQKHPRKMRAASFLAFGAIGAIATGAATAGAAGLATYGAIRAGRYIGGALAANIGKSLGGKIHKLGWENKYKNQHSELERFESILKNKTELNPSVLADYKKRLEKAHSKVEENKHYKRSLFKVAGAVTGTGLFIGANLSGAFDELYESAGINGDETAPDKESIEDTSPEDGKDVDGIEDKDGSENIKLTPEKELENYLSSYEPETASLIKPGEGIYHALLRQTGSVEKTMALLIENDYISYDSAGNLVEQVGVRDGMGASYDLVTLPDGTETIIEGVNGKPVYSECAGFYDACKNIVEIKGLDGSGDLITNDLERQEYLMKNRPKAPAHIPDTVIDQPGIKMPPDVSDPDPVVPDPQPQIVYRDRIVEVPVETEKVVEKHYYHETVDPDPVLEPEPLLEPEKVKKPFFKTTVGKILKIGGGIIGADLIENGKVDLFGLFGGNRPGGGSIEIPTPTQPSGPTLDPSASTGGSPSLDASL